MSEANNTTVMKLLTIKNADKLKEELKQDYLVTVMETLDSYCFAINERRGDGFIIIHVYRQRIKKDITRIEVWNGNTGYRLWKGLIGSESGTRPRLEDMTSLVRVYLPRTT